MAQVSGLADHYTTIGVARDADETTIKKAYRKLVLKWHPDKHPEDRVVAEEKIRAINNAYEVLSNPTKKSSYDQQWIALDLKSKGIQLSSSGISPRMSIPKEFMMSPLGHPEKFVRYQGWNLFVQSRSDVSVDFQSFFHVAKFSLWWLPEVNNMCRIRAAATAGAGVSGGTNLCFNLGPGKDGSEIGMTSGIDPHAVNFIAVNSPTMAGAFRFEVPYHPGHYLAFIQPHHIRVINNVVDSATTTLDFTFVDYSMMFKFITMEEVLIPAMHEIKGNDKFVPLDSLRCNASVLLYFRNILGKNVWDAEDFQMYFEGHYEKWDYDPAKNVVRLRSQNEVLAQQLKAATKAVDVAQVVASADETICEMLSLVSLERVLASLSEELAVDCPVSHVINRMAASKKILDTLPKIIKNSSNLRVQRLLFTAKALEDFSPPDEQIATKKEQARNALGKQITESLNADAQIVGTEVNIDELTILCSLPINWSECAESLMTMGETLWDTMPMAKYEELLTLLAKSAPQSKIQRMICERILPRLPSATNCMTLFLQCLGCYAAAQKVVDMLDASLFPADEFAKIVVQIIERQMNLNRMEDHVAQISAQQCSAGTLVQLAVSGTKCPALKPIMQSVCCGLADKLGELGVDDIAKVLLAASKAVAQPDDMNVLVEAADAVLTRALILTMSSAQIIKAVLACRTCVGTGAGKSLLERLANVAVDAHLSMPMAQLVLLTQGLIPLLDETDAFRKLLEFWEQTLADNGQNSSETDEVTRRRQEMEQKQLQPDQIAKLGQALAKTTTAASMKELWEAIGKILKKRASQLSATGLASLEAFPEYAQEYVAAVKKKRRRSSSPSSRSRSPSRSAKPTADGRAEERRASPPKRSPQPEERRGRDDKDRERRASRWTDNDKDDKGRADRDRSERKPDRDREDRGRVHDRGDRGDRGRDDRDRGRDRRSRSRRRR